MLEITNLTSHTIDHERLEAIYDYVLCHEGIDEDVTMSLVICDSKMMNELNRRYRGADKSTDVLSFPATVTIDEQDTQSCLGDIVIDINMVDEQKGKNSKKQELERVFIHGMLHIIGYDHIHDEDRHAMKAKEDIYNDKARGL